MKLHVGDQVLVTAGKDKGKQGKITRVIPKLEKVLVEGVNLYTKHIKPNGEQAGQKVRRERSLPMGNVAILNEKGQRDRVGYIVKDGKKERIYKKTGTIITKAALTTARKEAEKASKPADKKATKEVTKVKKEPISRRETKIK